MSSPLLRRGHGEITQKAGAALTSAADLHRISPVLFLRLRLTDFQDGEECLLRNIDLTHTLHPALAFLLLLQEFPFARDIAAVALRKHIFPHGRDGLAGDDLVPDR